MRSSKAINVLSGTVSAASLFWLYFSFHPSPPGPDRALHAAVGAQMATEAIQLLRPDSRLIVFARAAQPYQVPAAEAQWDGFMEVLQQKGKTVYALRSLQPDPLRLMRVPPGEFFDLLRQAREEDVIVSFLGPPVLDPEQLSKLGEKRPRVLALCSGAMPAQVNLKKLFDDKLLLSAVVSRSDPPLHPAGKSAQALFEQMFKLITPANVSELPAVVLH